MPTYVVFCCLILATTLLDGLVPASGFLWDLINALGFCALAGLVFLAWEAQSPARYPGVRMHSNLAIVVAVLTGLHILGFLLIDPVTFEYLKLKAPLYMLAGITGSVLILFLTITSFPKMRQRVYRMFTRFRYLHLVLSISAMGLSAWHVLGAAYYANAWYKQLLLIMIIIGVPLFAYWSRRSHGTAPGTARLVSARHADHQGLNGFIFALVISVAWAGVKNY
jgi:hypothetical protein